jgi:oligopeptide/dipeptide ABC transporter ATP-binding protein
MTEPILAAKDLRKSFNVGGGWFGAPDQLQALSDVSFDLYPGETLAVVGESGCGKSTLARCLTGLMEVTSGSFTVTGADGRAFIRDDALRFHRAVQIVFQDPYASLNPRHTVRRSIADPLRLHRMCERAEERTRVTDLLEQVGLSADYLDRYPHELSGGQRQRVCIARALAVEPKILVCDEPVSALDVSIQAQIINLLKDIQQRRGIAYVFISHNLALVRQISDRIAVMYLGEIVEMGAAADMRRALLHPYSRALFAATPVIGSRHEDRMRVALTGEVPSPLHPPSGCHFRTRCPFAAPRCAEEKPRLREVLGRLARCHFAEAVSAS